MERLRNAGLAVTVDPAFRKRSMRATLATLTMRKMRKVTTRTTKRFEDFMTLKAASGYAKGTAKASAVADTRYSFTAQFLCSSAIFARRCAQIERENPDNPVETIRTEHRGLVTAVIMQCAAAVEAESAEITLHGPGGHLGSNGIDAKSHKILAPLAAFIDDQRPLERYKLILHLLNKPPLSKGKNPWQDMDILFRARNELIHYNQSWVKR